MAYHIFGQGLSIANVDWVELHKIIPWLASHCVNIIDLERHELHVVNGL